MRKIIVIAVMLLSFGGLAVAQVPTAGNVFFGYSYQSDSSAAGIGSEGRVNLNGWQASLEGKLFPVLGIVADFSGHYGSGTFPESNGVANVSVSGHELEVLFGPRLGVSVGKFRPFGEFELGVGHLHTSGGVNLGGASTSFATAVGGGLDYKVIPHAALRIEADDVSTRFFGTTQNNFRLSTGIAVHF